MENIDRAVLETALKWLDGSGDLVLSTVAHTWGSSPRPAGSMMIWRPDGRFEGSLSGGCIEEELLERFAASSPQAVATVTYGVSTEQAVSRGLPCGGELTVVVERLRSGGDLKEIVERLARRERVCRTVDLDSGRTTIASPARHARTCIDERQFHAVFEPKWRLLVVGAGQLSSFVAQFATSLGYEVVICEPRENYRHSWMADDIEVCATMPDDFVRAARCDPQTAVLALTHDPKLDDLAIMEALNSESFYVGALGSSRTNAARRQRLCEHFGLSQAQLNFFSGPIGIDLGTRTASEIALAVMTEITARRNGVDITSVRAQSATQASA